MIRKAYIVTDLGPGDGGKGGVVHKISHMMRAHTVIKVGGAQGSHGVSTSAGERFAFSQWGCGTFEGTRTHISHRMVVSPEGLLNEAEALRYGHGLENAFDLLTVDREALCATPYHGIASRLKELARKDRPRGTIGTGIGEAYRLSRLIPELALRVGDLSRSDLIDRLAAVRETLSRELAPIITGGFLPEDLDEASKEIVLLRDDGFLRYIARRFKEVSGRAIIVDRDYLGRVILDRDGTVVIESSHGVLTDNLYGFHPHTSALRTLPGFTRAMLEDAGYGGEIVNVGVTRAYQIRHGAGPMPTADETMAENLLPGSHKQENRYQGKVRVGPLDLNLLRYAIEVCGGTSAFDGLAVTWFDQIRTNGVWHICDRYRDTGDRSHFSSSGAIRVRHGSGDSHRRYQQGLGERLMRSHPEITTFVVPRETQSLYALCDGILRERLNIPVRMVSFGPTERDKICK
ncbi:MAG TPA: adenylosuccinate synthetase [Candidatus Fimivivens sp.]|nr:adenylosuccinate synthetase [Candidatus Fimivivens sp.]